VSESLSQQEIDALFSGGAERAAKPAVATRPAREVQPYDFGRPARISKDRKRSLVAIYDLLAKSLEGWLTARCRDPIELEVESVEALTFGEFTLALRSPCASYVIDVNGRGGHQGVLDFGHEFAFFLVDRLLGGGTEVLVPDRGLTPLERLVGRIVADRVMTQLSEAWKDYVRLDLAVTGFESIPEMLQACNREDPVLVAHLKVGTSSWSSTLLVSLPFPVLEKFFTGDSTRRPHALDGTRDERVEDRGRLERSVLSSGVEVAARLPVVRIPLGRLGTLEPGDTFLTGLTPESGLEVMVDGQHRYHGSAGRQGRRIAVRITGEVPVEVRAARRHARSIP
jgi:flagellar motor switch protein FliM